jgi:malonyl-CoA decarboxylase
MEADLNRQSFLADLLQNISDRGRLLMGLRRNGGMPEHADFAAQCEALLGGRGEASGLVLAQDILAAWQRADDAERLRYLQILAAQFGPDMVRLERAVDAWQQDRSAEATTRLHDAAEPRRQELIRRLNMAPGATSTILDIRAANLALIPQHPELKAIDADMLHLITSWFNRGFLILQWIDWSTAANLLEKIIRYEAVHAIRSWDDLRRRLAPGDRRCFAFFHPRLDDEPLIFVEVALMRSTPTNIAAVLTEEREEVPASEATTAVFYSISNCQVGLRGVSFGNFLLKQVVEDLRCALPKLTEFVTLSPVPGFAAWLRDQEGLDDLKADLATPDWHSDPALAKTVNEALEPLLARYLVTARGGNGLPLDPVARFHLGNGASLDQLNVMGDLSPRAMSTAHGVMVNYRYRLEDLERNHELFATTREVTASPAIRRLADAPLETSGARPKLAIGA